FPDATSHSLRISIICLSWSVSSIPMIFLLRFGKHWGSMGSIFVLPPAYHRLMTCVDFIGVFKLVHVPARSCTVERSFFQADDGGSIRLTRSSLRRPPVGWGAGALAPVPTLWTQR